MDRAWDEAPASPLLDGRYRLGECIGQGGMGRVYRADDVVLGRSVAVKVVKPAGDVSNTPERVRNEVRLLAAVEHPSLVTLLDARIEDPSASYLVMEYVDGPSLAHRLRDGALTELEAASLAVNLASGLQALHRAGVVHRDITPSNILLAPSALSRVPFHAKLADFGVAFLLDSTRLTTPGMVVGTAAYLAPEQVKGDAAATPADIYALGLVLLEALTGERAYPHASGIGAIMARLVEPPRIPEAVGPVWTRLLSRMIAIDPSERPTADEVVAIATALCRTARPERIVAATRTSGSTVPVTSLPTQPLALSVLPAVAAPPVATVPQIAAVPPTRVAPGSGERASLRRSRARGLRRRRAVILIGAAALIAGLAIPAGWWAFAGQVEQPEVIATEPELDAPASLVPSDEDGAVTDASDDIVPASSSGAASDTAEQEGGARSASENAEREQEKAARDAEKTARDEERAAAAADHEAAKAQEKAEREQEKAARDAEKAAREAERSAKPEKRDR
ncbi:serine/threonine-protein kinase [Microbacterium insulae]|uniref:Serine/threonine-protein kinase n=1 Tax=Microbacterium insulae TaxID=483014 RepID=A0ABW3AJ62_9MICO